MAYTKDSIVGDIVNAKPQAKALIEKHVGRPVADWEIAAAAGMSLGSCASYIGWTSEKLEEIVNELNNL